METAKEFGTKGNKKGRPIWTVVKNSSLLIVVLLFVGSIVLVLDAYKFVSVRHAKFARKKLFRTLQYMDPSLIESHSGFKVLPLSEYEALSSRLAASRSSVREANSELQREYSAVLKAGVEIAAIKKDMADLEKLEEEKRKEDEEAARKAKEEPKGAEGAEAAAGGEAGAEEAGGEGAGGEARADEAGEEAKANEAGEGPAAEAAA